jgi:hypothetical protein
MPWYSVKFVLLVLLLAVFFLSGGKPSFQESKSAVNERTLTFHAGPGQPTCSIHVSTRESQGIVKIMDGSGSLVQLLTCPLGRSETEAVSQQFVARFAAEDVDLDGYLDLRGTRSFGAKWERDCVWLFDPQAHNFYQDSLSGQMEHLSNLTVDQKRQRIVSYSIGPTNPLWDEYRIERTGKDRPYWPRLIPVESCFIDTGRASLESEPRGKFTMVITRYEKDRSVVERHPMTAEDKPGPDAPCGSFRHRSRLMRLE